MPPARLTAGRKDSDRLLNSPEALIRGCSN
jgi:hypothetical protein